METRPEQSSEAAETPRRRFLKTAIGILGGIITLFFAGPMVATLIGPMYRRQQTSFAKLGSIAPLPHGEPVNLSFQYEKVDAYMRGQAVHNVWVIKHSATDVTVFSPICTHLGCRYNWDAAAQQFRCPCHGSIFSITGEVLGGPAPRPLDRLPHKIQSGELLVEWERFEPGVPQKVRIG
jgi:menaquinol-cytochrome c reductase iron-sulfur subunit